jgi:hypothetical protein
MRFGDQRVNSCISTSASTPPISRTSASTSSDSAGSIHQGAFALIGVRHGAVARVDAVCRDLTVREDRTILLAAARS